MTDPGLPAAEQTIIDGTVVRFEPDRFVLAEADVSIKHGKIVAVGKRLPRDGEVVDAGGGLVLPGLVNGHTHLGMSALRGLVPFLALEEWLRRIWAIERTLTVSDVHVGTALGLLEQLHQGTTTFNDDYLQADGAAHAALDLGARVQLVRGMIDLYDGKTQERLQDTLRLHGTFDGAGMGRLHIGVGIHSAGTVTEGLLHQGTALADRLGTFVHSHVHETERNIADFAARTGQRPLGYLHDRGMLAGGPRVLVHCCHLEPAEVRTLCRLPAGGVVTCPSSNGNLRVGTTPIIDLQAGGCRLAIGTDGAVSNPRQDLRHEGQLLARQADLSIESVAHVLTAGGAAVLGLPVGAVVVGHHADLVLVDGSDPAPFLRGAVDPRMVLVAGQQLVQSGRFCGGGSANLQGLQHDGALLRQRLEAVAAATA